ncbi:Pkinase-domain-containing protein [Athelia psychrophila]|uniref:non-specific serine/threonine protein kinase n=1 Tax=Athelia psychrophila TaxID=1759441 RepID=A0A167US35_9AGAM|nr:Pkinase-domain-containing protein [Fibularhizoctonia sp. CBS 109695]KZP22131.1 Pkinase-domain-containing protein [Fibularhizoctonia sp. CBS 109695]
MGSAKYPKVNGFELIQQIGGGGFSVVFRAVHIQDHRVAACKLVAYPLELPEKDKKTIDKEMRVHSALKHANVLEFLCAVVIDPRQKSSYVPGFYMLLDFAAGGDLFDKIAPDVGVGDDIAHYYFGQLVNGMNYIHEQGVCHRDLKPENLLLDAAGALKISDFGLSAVFMLKETGKKRTLTERCGSLPYVAPELNTDAAYQAAPIDVWGIGVILYTLLAGNTPWDEPTKQSPEFCRYRSGEIFSELPWCRIDESALSLIRGLLTIDPAQRMTLADVYQHPWCIRPSQLANQGVQALADKLTESLRASGDLGYAAPAEAGNTEMNTDDDGDDIMLSATNQSQFTQSLLLFSQTQSGRRYTPHLTRFYASVPPEALIFLAKGSLEQLGVKCKMGPAMEGGAQRLRVGGYDRRKVMFKGWVEIERFAYGGTEGSFCMMQRDEGNPISWRQLWKALIKSEAVMPHVLRR